jgi:hypothetical protein
LALCLPVANPTVLHAERQSRFQRHRLDFGRWHAPVKRRDFPIVRAEWPRNSVAYSYVDTATSFVVKACLTEVEKHHDCEPYGPDLRFHRWDACVPCFQALRFIRSLTSRRRATSRLLVTYRISVSALAIMHSPRSADIRWPRSRRRRTTPPHSRSSNRLKQETARPQQFPQDDPSFPAGSRIRTSASSPCRVAGNPVAGNSVCRPAQGSARSPGYSCPSVR